MDNLNINNLFDIEVINDNNNLNNELDVNNIAKLSNFENTNLSEKFIIDKLKNINKEEISNLKKIYDIKYKDCLLKINNAIDLGLTDIFFKITDAHFGIKSYNSHSCLVYIQLKLRKNKFETMILNKNSMFISWKNTNNSIKNNILDNVAKNFNNNNLDNKSNISNISINSLFK
jgi:hypothetical protein